MNNCPHDLYEEPMTVCRKCNAADQALQRELVEALRNGIVQMKIINGQDENCALKNVTQCANHMWIHRAEELYTRAEKAL